MEYSWINNESINKLGLMNSIKFQDEWTPFNFRINEPLNQQIVDIMEQTTDPGIYA